MGCCDARKKPYLSDSAVIALVVSPVALCALAFFVVQWLDDNEIFISGETVRMTFLLLTGFLFVTGMWMIISLKGIYRLCGVGSLLVALALTLTYEFIQ